MPANPGSNPTSQVQSLVVTGSRYFGFEPFFAQTKPNFGCKENPASSIKTIIAFNPFLIFKIFFSNSVETLLCLYQKLEHNYGSVVS